MIACLNVPYFAATVERRASSPEGGASEGDGRALVEPGQTPGLILGGQPWEPQPVYAFSHEAAQQGVKSGMSLRLAHVLSPEAQFMAADPPRYYAASAEITDVLLDFTHLIEIETLWAPHKNNVTKAAGHGLMGPGAALSWRLPAAYTLDLESLPPAEALSLAQEMGRQVRRQTRLPPAVSLAKSKFVAQVAASLTQPNHARSITADEEGAFLANQPVHFLPLDKETARRLSLLGIHTLGQLAGLPRSSIRTVLGPYLAPGSPAGESFSQFYRLVQERSGRRDLGDDLFLSVKTNPPAGQEQVTYRFDGPVADILVLEQVIERAATELAGRLQRAGLEGRTLQLILEPEGGRRPARSGPGLASTAPPPMILSRRSPAASPRQLADSLHELLNKASRQDAPGASLFEGIVCLTVILSDLTPAAATQLSLFDGPRITDRFREALEDILTRYKPGCFFRPVLTDPRHPLPERRFQLLELSAA
jgi:nucleotidyltransferase/DNA polymerase involved in DNA repair